MLFELFLSVANNLILIYTMSSCASKSFHNSGTTGNNWQTFITPIILWSKC